MRRSRLVLGIALACVLTGSSASAVSAAPRAYFAWDPPRPLVGETVTFDASGSEIGAGTPTYLWDFDTDGQYDDAAGVSVTHSFAKEGYAYVSLQVFDAEGMTDTDTRQLTVFAGPNTCFMPERGVTICNTGPTPEQCLDYAFASHIVARRPAPRRGILGRKAIRVRVQGSPVRGWGSPDNGCSEIGTRTVAVWQVMEDARGRLRRNSRVITATRSNGRFGKDVRLLLWRRYTCEPGSGKRTWGLRLRETASYSGVTRSRTLRFPRSGYPRFQAC
jgi:hypothetical protein